jgi:hypothetical protein
VHSIHALLAIAGSVIAVYVPAVGAGLVAVALVLTFGDGSGLFMLTRRLTGWRASQNVVSFEDAGKPGRLVLLAHYDAARGGAVFGRGPQDRVPPFQLFFWSMAVVLLCCLLRLPGLNGVPLTAVQFVPTVLLIVSIPMLLDIALSDVVPGANDNASGVATVLRLAERYGGALEYFDVCVLLTGSHEGFALGSRDFMKRRRKALEKERTVFVNVDEVGAGRSVRYSQREGLLLTARSHVQLVELCDEIAEDGEDAFDAAPFIRRAPGDAPAGYPGITISCRPAPHHHRPSDTPDHVVDESLERAFGFCCELVERLDAAIGPDLEQGGVSEQPVPSR